MGGRAGPTTIRDVAALAGVSPASVSNYFNNPGRMSAATRERVRSAVEALDFAPNDAASRLRRGGSSVVGYLSHELATARTPAITNALSKRLAGSGLHLLSAVDGGDPVRERAFLDLFARQRVAGLVVTPVTDVEPELARLRARGLASVLCAHASTTPEQASVSVDHLTGGRLAAQHLVDLGRRRLAFVTDTLDLPQIADRFEGLRQVALEAGASVEVIWADQRSVAAGEEAARQVLDRDPRATPDALLGVNDLVALGLCAGLRGHTSIPDDIAVIGYDDIEFARLGAVPLTSVRTPQEVLGETAADLVLEEIAGLAGGGLDLPRPRVLLEPLLVVRESTAGTP